MKKLRQLWLAGRLCAAAAAFAAGLSPGPACAEDGEFYVNTYRSVGKAAPQGLRAAAMGGAGRAMPDGMNSLGVNPAALGAFQGKEFDASLGYDWLDDGLDGTNQVSFKIGGAVNLDRWQSVSGANQAVGALLHTQDFSSAGRFGMGRDQTSVLAGYGIHLMDNLLAGVSVALFDGSWTSEKQPLDPATGLTPANVERSFTGGDFRVGGIYRLRDETTVGGTLGYATGSLKEAADYAAGAGSGSLNRFSLGIGAAHQYTEDTLLAGDLWYERLKSEIPGVADESSSAWGLAVGVEQRVIPELLALRGGLYYDSAKYTGGGPVADVAGVDSFSEGRYGITAGLGLRLYNFDFGYSLDINSGGDVKNLFDFAAEW